MNVAKDALNRLAKWRTVFAGWQLGTHPKGDPESDAVRDHREATLLLRVEVTALATTLIDAGVITQDAFVEALRVEADLLNTDLERRFPGFSAHADGIHMDPQKAAETTRGWRP